MAQTPIKWWEANQVSAASEGKASGLHSAQISSLHALTMLDLWGVEHQEWKLLDGTGLWPIASYIIVCIIHNSYQLYEHVSGMLTLLTPPASLGILQPATLPTKFDPYFKIPIFWHCSNHTFQGIVARAYINRSFGCLSWEGLTPADNHIIAQAHLCKGFPQAATPNDHRWWVRFRFRQRGTSNAPRLGAPAAPACLAGDEASARRGQYLSRQAAGPPLGRRPQRRLAPLKAVRRSAHHRTPQTQGHGKSWLEGQVLPRVSVFEPLTAGVFCWPVAIKVGKRYCHNLTLYTIKQRPPSILSHLQHTQNSPVATLNKSHHTGYTMPVASFNNRQGTRSQSTRRSSWVSGPKSVAIASVPLQSRTSLFLTCSLWGLLDLGPFSLITCW